MKPTFTAPYTASDGDAVKERHECLEEVMQYFAGTEAAPDPKKQQNVDSMFVDIMQESNKAARKDRDYMRSLPESTRERNELQQALTIVVLLTLPGLARKMSQDQNWCTPAAIVSDLRNGAYTTDVDRHGLSAVVMDTYILPFVRCHPLQPKEGGTRPPISAEVLEAMVRDGYMSKSLKLARQKRDQEEGKRVAVQRQTAAEVKEIVEANFGGPVGAERLPSLMTCLR